MSLIQNASLQPPQPERETQTRKRKRDDGVDSIELDKRPFAIRPDASDPFAAPRVFTPVCLLSRAQVPLAYLDTTSSGSRFFSANVRALETRGEGQDVVDVLVAEDEKERRIYAIERTQKYTYALCRLSAWVTKQQLERAANILVKDEEPQIKRQARQPVVDGQPWWTRTTVVHTAPLLTNHGSNEHQLKLSMHTEPVTASLPVLTEQKELTTGVADQVLPPVEEAANSHRVTASDALQELAKQYLEALYISRTSLAYFSKGPLSRARAAFSGQADSEFTPEDLTAFLREAILSATVMDKKYRDAITAHLKDIPETGLETPEQPMKSKKKRKWKSKRDKAGLWQDEKDYVEKWWRTQDDATGAHSSAEPTADGLKRRLPRVRSRETYLQIILALEVLALEAVPLENESAKNPANASTHNAPSGKSQTQETQDLDSQTLDTSKKPKAKKPADLPALLDTLVDRLCISQSLDSHSPAKKAEAAGGKEDDANDELKNFCVEVIIPFYMPRIPQHAAAVNKKLGGPSAPTPAKPRSRTARKPGEPAVRQAPDKKARRPLSRVASEAAHHASRPVPSLHRSATDTDALLPLIKRENSETPSLLESIPAARVPPQPRKRTSLVHSISFSKREVDFSAMSRSNENKLRKKAEVDQKLHEAISTLRKPNRALAVKEVAESADASHAKAIARTRPGAPLQRKKSDFPPASVHIAATPKRGKHPSVPEWRDEGRAAAERYMPPSTATTSYIPASSRRPTSTTQGYRDYEPPSSTIAVPQTGHRPRHAAPDTPSRGFAKYMPPALAHAPGTLESPLATRHAGDFVTPSKPIRSLSFQVPAAKVPSMVAITPKNVGRGAAERDDENEVVDKEEKGEARGASVYDALGWNDEYEDLT